jgi:hypothetical protein
VQDHGSLGIEETRMKKLLLVLLALGLAAAIAYLLGTPAGRARRDDLLARARNTHDDVEIDLTDQSSTADDLASTTAPS